MLMVGTFTGLSAYKGRWESVRAKSVRDALENTALEP